LPAPFHQRSKALNGDGAQVSQGPERPYSLTQTPTIHNLIHPDRSSNQHWICMFYKIYIYNINETPQTATRGLKIANVNTRILPILPQRESLRDVRVGDAMTYQNIKLNLFSTQKKIYLFSPPKIPILKSTPNVSTYRWWGLVRGNHQYIRSIQQTMM
jgi:hypothetical protein